MRRALVTSAVLATLLLSACVYLPRATTVYDEECQVLQRRMVLELEQVGVYGGCFNDGCAAMLVAAGVVTAASAIISGSIVVAGNIIYWFERRGQCAR